MSEHQATVDWQRQGTPADFLAGRYSREHAWSFDGGVRVPASPAPSVVPAPWSNPAHVDPEEAYVASVASCHLLTFLYVAGRRGFQVDAYRDQAVGRMGKNERGVPWVREIVLRPEIRYGGGRQPTAAEEADLHHAAHDQCFIANSVKTEIRVEAPAVGAASGAGAAPATATATAAPGAVPSPS